MHLKFGRRQSGEFGRFAQRQPVRDEQCDRKFQFRVGDGHARPLVRGGLDVAVAFVVRSGVDSTDEHLRDLLARGGRVRFLRGDYLDATEPEALSGLLDLDGGDLLALCQENVVYRCDVFDGLDRELLSPFRYFGFPDEVDSSNIPWRSSRFDEETLTAAVATEARPILLLPARKQHPGLPRHWTKVLTSEGEFEANFVMVAINVMRRPGSSANELPGVLRKWFGPNAGKPGTRYYVLIVVEASPDGTTNHTNTLPIQGWGSTWLQSS